MLNLEVGNCGLTRAPKVKVSMTDAVAAHRLAVSVLDHYVDDLCAVAHLHAAKYLNNLVMLKLGTRRTYVKQALTTSRMRALRRGVVSRTWPTNAQRAAKQIMERSTAEPARDSTGL